MKGVIQWLNFQRVMILGCLAASLLVAWMVYQKHVELSQLNKDVANAPLVVRSIQARAQELDQLMKAASREGLKGEGNRDDTDFYIRQIAQMNDINIGQVDINFSSTEPFRGVEDLVYKIKPSERDSKFLRASVANFLYKLEELSRRVRVTSLKLTPHQRLKPGEIGNDFWTFETEITARRATE